MKNAHDIRRAGFTMAEMVIVVAVIGIMAAIAVPSTARYVAKQRLRDSARSVARVLSYARSEAIRTGNIHLVFFETDAQGNSLDGGARALVVNDGRPGSADQNCALDSGEPTHREPLADSVSLGLTQASASVPTDVGTGSISSGSSFTDGGGNAASWVLFRPEGTPLPFDSSCAIGAIGDGGGGIYLTDGSDDVAVVLTPLGASRVFVYDGRGAQWRD